MDSQPSGNKQIKLVAIDTPKIYFGIKGKYKKTEFEYPEDIFENNFHWDCVDKEISEEDINVPKNKPIFYEYEDYQIIIENKGKHAIRFYHEDKRIREQIDYITDNTMTGVINFNSSIGLSELIVYVDEVPYLTIRIEVFPKKIDYKKDYYNILKDVNEEIYNLSFEFLRRTYLNMTILEKEGNSLTEYYHILRVIYEKLIKSIKVVMNQPHHTLKSEGQVVPYQKLKRGNEKTIRWMAKNPDKLYRKNGKIIPVKAMEFRKIPAINTYENQFLKYMLLGIVKKLRELRNKYEKLERIKDELFLEKLETMVKEISFYIHESFLKEVTQFEPRDSFSLVLKMAPGYREIYKCYLMLRKGLTLYGDIFKMSMKELAQLYEYWCFIKINSLLRKKYKLIKNDMIKINTNGIFVTLKKGSTTRVTYQNPKNGEIFTISYNLKMQSETIGQKPDNVFAIYKDGKAVQYNYIFDAKYRLNGAESGTSYKRSYDNPGPEESDINTMHRYRDAIIYNHKDVDKLQKNIFGAFVLFPYDNEEEYENHRFYRSIESVNIGGIPFLPDATKLMEKFLDELIEESPLSSYERRLEQRGKEYYLKNNYFDSRNVLVGSLRNKEQLKVNLDYKFYHTSLKNVDMKNRIVKTIAIAQSNKTFGKNAGVLYYGKVKEIKIIKRSEIKEIPIQSGKDPNELYVRFEIEEWQKLKPSIQVERFNVIRVMYTTDYLLHHAESISELCIKSAEEFRIWMELKRLENELAVLTNDEIETHTRIKGFKIEEKQIYLFDDKIRVIQDENYRDYDRKDFRKNPKRIVRMICEESDCMV
ncbi:MAG: restriction endonuclease-like protein [Marinisporobacter sp.]|jgi:predicted component of viral defense system (DUF524 family)|nr:restriction endonuclease-like protein [Marinisporobacter sp.]